MSAKFDPTADHRKEAYLLTASDKAGVFFNQFAETFDTFYEGKRSWWMQRVDWTFRRDIFVRFRRTFEEFGNLAGKTVLDIGCGSGFYVAEAIRRGASHVVAVDPAPRMLELVRERLRKVDAERHCTLVPGSFPGVPLDPCDHVIVMGVMDYVRHAETFLGNLRPLVRQSAAISFPSRHFFRTPIRKLRYYLRNCPVFFYDESQIHQLCARRASAGPRCTRFRGRERTITFA